MSVSCPKHGALLYGPRCTDCDCARSLRPGKRDSQYNKREFAGRKLDIYRVLELFDITHPAQQHAVKKLIRAGKSPAKDLEQDIEEVIESLDRWLEMIREDYKARSESFERGMVAMRQPAERARNGAWRDLVDSVADGAGLYLSEVETMKTPKEYYSPAMLAVGREMDVLVSVFESMSGVPEEEDERAMWWFIGSLYSMTREGAAAFYSGYLAAQIKADEVFARQVFSIQRAANPLGWMESYERAINKMVERYASNRPGHETSQSSDSGADQGGAKET